MAVQQTGRDVQPIAFDPVSRVAGPLAFRGEVDLRDGRVLGAEAMATHFRGYEIVLQGRDVRDAIFISSRACGVCGGAHAKASALACEMAFGIQPPPTGIVGRNLLAALENLSDYPMHLFTRVGPDFSEPVVRETNPELWERALQAAAPGAPTHGYKRISDIMTGLTRFSGKLYAEALRMSRVAREAYVLIGGKYPHPQTIVPGGLSAKIDRSTVNHMFLRAVPFLDYGQKVAAIWDDLTEFFYAADPRFREVGAGPSVVWPPGLDHGGSIERHGRFHCICRADEEQQVSSGVHLLQRCPVEPARHDELGIRGIRDDMSVGRQAANEIHSPDGSWTPRLRTVG